jgi:parvulin-like peptidyl-prolyl isomerase
MGSLLIIFMCTSLGLAMEDAIIAVVNDEVVTLKDLRDYIRTSYASLAAEGLDDQALKEAMRDLEINGINKLIEDNLILSRANEIELEVREKLIDDRVEIIKKRYGSEKDFLDALIQHGATVTDLRNKIRDQYKIQFVIDYAVDSKIYVNPQEITQYYEENQSRFQMKEGVNLDSIYIAFGNNKIKARQKAAGASQLIKEGTDFQEVATQYSDSPSIGIVERGQTLPAIEETVFTMEINQISEPIELDSGIYIFKLKEKIAPQAASLDDVKGYVYDILYRQKFQENLSKWLAELKKDAYIEFKE